ncbi:MAG: 2-oxoacid:acceptor oxidoreductase subunit alpha [Proteocatella sp.]|jgi:2-oxoglutarate ferredoxin oxidoreductase subunit alpha|nr:2-oxoacid:acceptor oxidoreductase subunit alpha [Proteocatella sp.]MBP8654327.1 2-oxoacid:acceptor oxidoreductase subunit alpha [Proteocatella sp.]MBP9658991.1 2-oxoacid:acceptor oxidoreductase subunit alpha [Proteocatella sp.]MBP9966631.1 2-oxoacid:acceptor oxidoreductase subunit alpha [Proteocatella sp.]NCB71137.1 2-oxoacid:acceptor oxidoreductase subunit alpha [Clostridia bacterium]
MSKKVVLMQGNEACVHGALYAGMEFFAGYPITPSTEIAEVSSELLPRIGGRFIQMEDEIAGIAACIGGAIAGKKSMTATSGPGFSLKQENIGYACIAEIPCVIVNVQRSGPSTGLPTSPAQGDYMQARWGTHGDHPVIALSPTTVRETFELTVKAFNFAEKFRTPVILLMDEVVGHLRENMEVPEPGELEVIDRKRPDCPPEEYRAYAMTEDLVPPMADFGKGYRYNITGLFHDETGFPTNNTEVAGKQLDRIMKKVENNFDEINIYEEYMLEDAQYAFITFGGMARSVKEAIRTLRKEGIRIGAFIPKTVWPFPEKQINKLVSDMDGVFVAEMNLGQMILEVQRASQERNKIHAINKANGEVITPEEIIKSFMEVHNA